MLRILFGPVLLLSWCVLAFARGGDAVTWAGKVDLPGGAQLEFSVELTADAGTISIPAQGAKDLALSDVKVTERSLHFAIASAGAVWDLGVSDDGNTATGVLKQGGEFPATLRRLKPGETVAKELVRPQEPKPPFPYPTVDVQFPNAAARVKLSGTLSMPQGTGPFPCLVMVTGSGPQDRDEALLGHKPFLVIADHLARHGIATLRYDDRGVGKSTGSFAKATTDDFASDALAAVTFLLTRAEIDPKRIGILGHSEGGLIAPMCAAQSKEVAFAVLLAGPGLRGAELLALQTAAIGRAAGQSEADAAAVSKTNLSLYQAAMAGKSREELRELVRAAVLEQLATAPETRDLSEEERAKKADETAQEQSRTLASPWFRRFLALDPSEALGKTGCPVLALNGSKDTQVPARENLAGIEKALKTAGNRDVTIRELPELNHLFQTCTTGSPDEYVRIEETISPLALEVLTSWVRARAGLEERH